MKSKWIFIQWFKYNNIRMKDDSTNKFGSLNLAVLVLSVYVLGALIVDTTIKLPEETSRLLNYIDLAIWWSYVTITTVGYGDKYPVTTEGRIIAMFLMTAGVGLFGTFTAYIASLFVSDNKKEETETKE
ncbi:potassium channel family protein [Porphyromonas gingivalis]|nr:potassium channel family protein [Porphyromonas gingivalis]